ncbi:UPF0104 family protein [Candidatus Parcubacteria bacterium]|nr:MAG: UPF0104 family protein [Candidatus Parcubacteria bacterium]
MCLQGVMSLWLACPKNLMSDLLPASGKYPKRTFLWKATLSGGLLVWLLGRLDWRIFFDLITHGRWVFLFPAVACLFGGILLSVYRWKLILSDLGVTVSDFLLWRLILTGFFFNQFLPSTIGGDGYRFLRLHKRYPDQRAPVIASIVLDRTSGYIALLGVHFALLPLAIKNVVQHEWLGLIEIILGIGVICLFVLWVMRHRWIPLFSRLNLPSFALYEKVLQFLELVTSRRRRAIALALVFSAIFVILNGVALGFYLRVLGFFPSWLPVLLASTLSSVVGVLPISINGLGLVEVVAVIALEPIGLPQEGILLAIFLLRVANLAVGLIGGLLYGLEPWLKE